MSEEKTQAPAPVVGRNVVDNFVNSVEKCVRTMRMYAAGGNTQTLDNVFQNIFGLLQSALADEEEHLDIVVKAFELLHNRRQVYENKDKKHSLAFHFYDCGIRRLRFKRGIGMDEFMHFIKIIAADFSSKEMMDQDLYSLFFEAQMTHFEAAAADLLAERRVTDSELDTVLTEFRNQQQKKLVEKTKEMPRRVRPDDVKVLEEFHISSSQFSKSDEELAKIIRSSVLPSTAPAKERETLERLALMGFHFLLQDKDLDQVTMGRSLLVQVTQMMLENRHLDLLAALIERLHALQVERQAQRGEYQKILDAIYSTDRIEAFARHLNHDETKAKTLEILTKSSAAGARLITLLLGRAPFIGRVFADFLIKNLGAHSQWLQERAASDPDSPSWEPLVNILALRPNQQLGKFLTTLLDSAKETVKLKILRQCASLASEETLQVFDRILRGEDPAEKKICFTVLAQAKTKGALKILRHYLESPQFAETQPDEKVEGYSCLLAIGGEASYAWFEAEWMKQGSGFFKGKALNERRELLVKAAAISAPTFIEKILQKTPLETLPEEMQREVRKVMSRGKS